MIRLQLCYHFLLSQILDLRAERILPRVKLDYLDAWPSPGSSVVTPRRICGKPQRVPWIASFVSLTRWSENRIFAPSSPCIFPMSAPDIAVMSSITPKPMKAKALTW